MNASNQSVRFPHVEFQKLFDIWNSVRGGKLLPNRNDLRLTQLGDLTGLTYLLHMDLPDRILMSFAGADIADRAGIAAAGLNILDCQTPAHRDQIVACAYLAAKQPNGIWHEYDFVADDGTDGRISTLVIPLADATNDVRFALGTNVITLTDAQPSDTLRYIAQSTRLRSAMLDLGNGVPDNDILHNWNTLIDDL